MSEEKWSGRRGSNPQLSAWEPKFSLLCFQYLQNRPIKMYMHPLHTLHALPDLRVAGGRLGDGFSRKSLFLGTRFVRSLRANSDGLPALARSCEISES